ncbi:hypothetical protein [Dickeya phage Kamild]|uniref:Phage protein n=17 Tax=Aglimvirinae TaxID=2169530 RepID=A0A3G2K9K4_9CAUD|nr:hypothetical protein [Dickeya phage Kamild]
MITIPLNTGGFLLLRKQIMVNASIFINRGLLAIAHSHALHFVTTSYAKHKALGEFYGDLEDLLDTFTEAYIGAGGQYVPSFENIKLYNPDPIAYVNSVALDIDGIYRQCDSHLQNTLDEIKTLCYQTLYKLKQLS